MSTPEDNAWPAGWSEIYDAMDLDRGLHLDFYSGLAGPDTRSLLDLGCGTGSITLAIAANMAPGASVVGVDLAPKMIEIARARAPQHDWRVGDIAAPGVAGQFDLVVICFHTLQLLLDDAAVAGCLSAVAGCLAPGGRFAFDIYRPNPDWLAAVDATPREARRYTDAAGRGFVVMDRDAAYDPETRILSGNWTLHEAATGAMVPLAPITQRLRQYFPEDIARHLAAAGLEIADRFGELDRRPLTPDSKRQIYICRAA